MKTILLQLKQHPDMLALFAVLSSLLSFILQTWQINIILVLCMFLLIAIDTTVGVRKAIREKVFNYRVLQDKTVKKVLGRIIFIISISIFTIMMYLVNMKDGTPFIHSYYLNIPLMTSILFFSAIDLLSIIEKIKGDYGIQTPDKITNKLRDFVDNQDLKNLTKHDN